MVTVEESSTDVVVASVPFPDFSAWFQDVVDEVRPDLVVAVARGALRLLQLHRPGRPLLGDRPVISQHALAFVDASALEGKRVLIFDDSVIYGSTMREAYTRLTAVGAIVTCAAFVVDKETFYGNGSEKPASPHSVVPLVARHLLTSRLVQRHHDELVQALIRFRRDYNIDFPAIALRLVPGKPLVDVAEALLKTSIIEEFVEVSTSLGAAAGVHRGSVFFSGPLSALRLDASQRWRQFSKARLTWCKAEGELRITPLAQIAIAETLGAEDLRFESDLVARWWKLMHQPNPDAQHFETARFRLLNAFVSTVLAAALVREFREIGELGYAANEATLDLDDIDVILTPKNSAVLRRMFAELVNEETVLLCRQASDQPAEIALDSADRALISDIETFWLAEPYFKPSLGDLAYEAVAKILLSLKRLTDSPQKRGLNSYASRLDVGLSHEGIVWILSESCGLEYSVRDVALGIDIAIDCGQAVPNVLEADGWRMRRLYCGEAGQASDPLQFKAALHRHYTDYLASKSAKKLTPYGLTKMCVVLKDVFPRLPISTHYRTYGRTATLGPDELVAAVSTGPGAPLTLTTVRNSDFLDVNPHFRALVENTWDSTLSRVFADSFHLLSKVFSAADDNAVLLLSTCRTHRHAFNAIAVEAHHWIGAEASSHGFEELLNALHAARATRTSLSADGVHALVYLASYINESERKRDVFYSNFETYRAELEKAFLSQGTSGRNYWQYEIVEPDFLDDSHDDEITHKFSSLQPILEQMKWLTAFTSATLQERGLLNRSDLSAAFIRRTNQAVFKKSGWAWGMASNAAAEQYNSQIRKTSGLTASMIRTELPAGARHEVEDVLKAIGTAYLEITDALLTFCPKYPVDEGNPFPFAPDLTVRRLNDGTVETQLLNQFILAMDIVKSNDSAPAADLKNEIIAAMDKFQNRDLYYSTSGEDRFVCSSRNPRVLWDLLHVVRSREDMFVRSIDGCQGTRKGMFSGPITLQRRPDGRVSIKDVADPHRISIAVGVMESAEKSDLAGKRPLREVVAVEAETARRFAGLLQLNLEGVEEVDVRAKHIKGGKAFVIACP